VRLCGVGGGVRRVGVFGGGGGGLPCGVKHVIYHHW